MLQWRLQMLHDAGWEDPYAEILAVLDDVDLHRACDLLAEGCDAATAWAILT